MQKWEYRRAWKLTIPELNELGRYGWEVIQIIESDEKELLYFLKRPLLD